MPRPSYHPNPIRGGGNDAYTGVDHVLTEPWKEEAHNVRLVAHSDLNGWATRSRFRWAAASATSRPRA